MRLKSYFAGTVESAMRLAREEMGDEALLVNSRKAPPEARHLGEYEVVFGVAPALGAQLPDTSSPAAGPALSQPGTPAAAQPVPAAPPAAPTPGPDLAAEVAGIRRQLERMAAGVTRSNSLLSGRRFSSPEMADAFSWLTAAEVDPDLALAFTRGLEQRLSARPLAGVNRLLAEIRQDEGLDTSGSRRLRDTLQEELASRIKTAPELASHARASRGQRLVALVGPPGAGKTTTLTKLAVTYGVTARRPTHLISLDTCRIAAADQLRSYAAIIGAGFHACDSIGTLAQALEECRHKELILIDTPGYGMRDLDAAGELIDFLVRAGTEIHLVLSASAKPADLSRVVNRFRCLRPTRLLFTRLDETETYGVILNETLRADLPISFLSTGQQVPEDLEPASPTRIADLVLNGRRTEASVESRTELSPGPGC